MGQPTFKKQHLKIDVQGDYKHKYDVDRIPYVNECVRCKNVDHLAPCSNCGSTVYTSGFTSEGEIGVFCYQCNKGFSRHTCSKCGTDNAVANSFGTYESGGCFIATAAYGSALAPEVDVFRNFRDGTLLTSKLGSLFVKTYYFISPPLASVISKSEWLRLAVRRFLLEPILSLLKPKSKSDE